MLSIHDVARYGKRTAKAVLGKDALYLLDLRVPRLKVGNADKEWTIIPANIGPGSLMYSVGVGEDVSADLALIAKFGLEIHAFDPTPKSIDWVARQSLPAQFRFHPLGLAHYDGVARFTPPENAEHVSHTMLARPSLGGAPIEVPVRRLSTFMQELGHSHLDILKIDVEGAEYGIIADILASGISIGQFLVEFHHVWPEVGFAKTKAAISALRNHGFKLFDVSASGHEFGFCR